MNPMAACAEDYSSSTCDALELFVDMGLLIVCIGLWLLFASVNDRLIRHVWRGWRDSCGCNKCVWRTPIRAALAAGVNMPLPIADTVFFRSASHHVRTFVGDVPAVAQSPLSVLAFVATVAALAYICAAIYTLLNARNCHNQPCLLETGAQDSGGDEADAVVQWENQTISCGDAWERELAGALGRKR